MYHLSAYYLSKTVSELPLVVVQPTFFLIITYWIVGLHGVASFFGTLLVIITNSIVAQVTIIILLHAAATYLTILQDLDFGIL